jgi:hypothetical protein
VKSRFIDSYHNFEIAASRFWLNALLRVAVVISLIVFRAVVLVFLFIFFVVWLLSKYRVDNYRLIKRIAALWMYSAHVQWYAKCSYSLTPSTVAVPLAAAILAFSSARNKIEQFSGFSWYSGPPIVIDNDSG